MRNKWIAAPYVGWMALFVVAPLIVVLVYALTRENAAGDWYLTMENFAGMAGYAAVFGRSFLLAGIATVICILLGYPMAYFLSRERGRLRSMAMLLIMLPMWMNFLLRTYSWVFLLERNGFFNTLLSSIGLPKLDIINTSSAVVLGMVYNFLPFMVLPIFSVIVKIDHRVIEAAQDLGADIFRVLGRVLIPLAMPGIATGITMVFVPSVSTFIISRMLGGGDTMLVGDLIELQFLGNSYNYNLGSAMSLVLMVIVLLCMSLTNTSGNKDGVEGVM